MSTAAQVNIFRTVPVRHEVDVFVAGGGPAGMAAAVTAARQGLRVFLAEGQACFGGMGTAGLLPIFMAFGDRTHFYADGFGREVYERLRAAGGFGPFALWSELAPCIRGEVLKRVYDEMVVESKVDFAFGTQVIAVEREEDRIAYVLCAAKSGLFAVKASMYIDGTGDGDLAAWAGAPFEQGDANGNVMPGTLCSLWADVDWEAVQAAGLDHEAILPQAFADGVFTIQDPHLPGMYPVDKHVAGGNLGHGFGVDGTDERSLTRALLWGRKVLPEYERFYKQYLRGYEAMTLVATAAQYGVRETRRITGDYRLIREDYETRAIFPDEIGRFNYWLDVHAAEPDPEQFTQHLALRTNPLQDGESYGIPYRALTPKTLSNLLVAGRCISTDRYLQSSMRVMPGCFITGQAAGMAAALAVEGHTDTRAIAIPALQRRLLAMGAFLPNAILECGA